MSMFLPEQQGQPQSGVVSVTPSSPETTSEDIALMQRVFAAAARNPNLIPADFMAYVFDFIQTQRLEVPIGQVFGFAGFTFVASPLVSTSETTVATAYSDLATVGPTLDGLGDGRYAIFLTNLSAIVSAGQQAYMGASVNGAPASDSFATEVWSSSFSTPTRPFLTTLSGGANSIKAVYRSSGGSTATFKNRQIFAVRYANL